MRYTCMKPFIGFMLSAIDESFNELLKVQTSLNSSQDRMKYFINIFTGKTFSRKEYMNLFKDNSPDTASRDLLYGMENNLLKKQGDKRTTIYHILV